MQKHSLHNKQDLLAALNSTTTRTHALIGEILVEEGLITREQLQRGLAAQQGRRNVHLGDILVELQLASPEVINVALAKKLGIPYVDIREYQIEPAVISSIPPDIAMHYNVVPLAQTGDHLVVAMDDPFNWEALEILRFNTRKNVDPVLASTNDIGEVLNKFYAHFNETELLHELKTNVALPESNGTSRNNAHSLTQEANKPPVVRLLDAIISQALLRGASDINIRPGKDRVNVYFRVDGSLVFVRSFHTSLLAPLVSRIKITGMMDITERRLPQDGHARVFRADKPVDLRLSVIPTITGESVVIRILDKEVGVKPLEALGYGPNEVKTLRSLINRSTGMVLAVGPTGSGKSTTLYALLNEIRHGNPHIITVEDPAEYDIDGVEQIQVAPDRGYDFAEALRHILRHDPDVIMIGEIRDAETVQIANKAALTGHLVLSTLHTNDAASTVTRLLDMGVESYLLSSTLQGILAQRLIRLICTHCRTTDKPDPEMLATLGVDPATPLFRGAGCPSCNNTGYHGRNAVCELLPVTPAIRRLVAQRAEAGLIKEQAVREGMVTLTENALILARQGKVTLEDVYAIRLE